VGKQHHRRFFVLAPNKAARRHRYT